MADAISSGRSALLVMDVQRGIVERFGNDAGLLDRLGAAIASAVYPAAEQVPPPWAAFVGAGPLGALRGSDLHRGEAAPAWPGSGDAVVMHDG